MLQKVYIGFNQRKDSSFELFFFLTVDSLKNFKKFYVSEITKDWTEKRYSEWCNERGEGKTQLQNETDADLFLNSFYSKCNGNWWTEEYADELEKMLPDNSAKNIVVWNPGCGKGFHLPAWKYHFHCRALQDSAEPGPEILLMHGQWKLL